MMPSTSVQISTRSACSAAPSSAALKSEPPRPRVVGRPSGVEPMKPWVTGTRPASSSGPKSPGARWASAARSGWARVKRASVIMARRTSTHSPGSPWAASAAATRRELQSSPMPATRSVSSSVGGTPSRSSRTAPRRWASALIAAAAPSPAASSAAIAAWRAPICSRLFASPASSPPSARASRWSSALVTPDSADTTTTGRSATRGRMMSASRRIAAASPTEVPPNLQTIIAPTPPRPAARQAGWRPRRRPGSGCGPSG